MKPATLRILERISAYLPLAGAGLLLALGNFWPSVIDQTSTQILVASVAVSVLLVAVHLESRLASLTAATAASSKSLAQLEGIQTQLIGSATPLARAMSLAQSFELVASRSNHWRNVRIYAISSSQVLSFFRFQNLTAEECTVIIRGFPENEKRWKDLASQTALVVRDWRTLERTGRIKHLTVLSYDYFPSEYTCIFDDQLLLVGLFESDPSDYSGVRVGPSITYEGSHPDGVPILSAYRERFDILRDACLAGHHGPSRYLHPRDLTSPEVPGSEVGDA